MNTRMCVALVPAILLGQEAAEMAAAPRWFGLLGIVCVCVVLPAAIILVVALFVRFAVARRQIRNGTRAVELRCRVCGVAVPPNAPQGLCPRCLAHTATDVPSPPARSPSTVAYRPGLAAITAQQLASRFPQLEIGELLGKGGMGAVYKARQTHLDRFVALKILPPETARDPAFAERFAREARALARLNHPNIVGVHDFGQSDGLYYLLMEYVDGVNLRQAMRAGHFTPEEALRIVPQLCDALQFAHDEGVVHRDIKPENILLDKRGRVKVADFGLAKLLGQSAEGASLTGTQQVMGTLHYMAPEQLAGARAVDHRADIYALGVTFYEMLTGELPLGRFPPPSKKAAVDSRLDPIVLRTLEHEPAARYQHASEIKTDIESLVDPSFVQPQTALRVSQPPGRMVRQRLWSHQLWRLLWTAVCVVLYVAIWSRIGFLDRYLWPYHGMAESTVTFEPTPPGAGQPALYRRLVVTEKITMERLGWPYRQVEWRGDGPRSERARHDFVVELDLNDGSNRMLFISGLDGLRWRHSHAGQFVDGAALDLPTALGWMDNAIKGDNQRLEELRPQARFWVELVQQATYTDQRRDFVLGRRRSVGRLDAIVWDMRSRWLNDHQPFPFRDPDWIGSEQYWSGPQIDIVWVGVPVMFAVWFGGLWLLPRKRRTPLSAA